MSDDDLLQASEAAEYLREIGLPHTASTLAKLRTNGNGPIYLRIGRGIRYRRSRLREYVTGRTREMASTSSATPVADVARLEDAADFQARAAS
jgi:hypothetical protein